MLRCLHCGGDGDILASWQPSNATSPIFKTCPTCNGKGEIEIDCILCEKELKEGLYFPYCSEECTRQAGEPLPNHLRRLQLRVKQIDEFYPHPILDHFMAGWVGGWKAALKFLQEYDNRVPLVDNALRKVKI